MSIEYVTAGESHGEMLVGIISNIPAGLKIEESFIDGELARRWLGAGRGARKNIENDRAKIVGGVREHKSTGSPIAIIIANADHKKRANDKTRLTAVRPGHADLAGAIKYGFDDANPVAERASARETAMTVALGAVAKLYLGALGITVESYTAAVGSVSCARADDYSQINKRADINAERALDGSASKKILEEINTAALAGDTLGGVTEIVVSGCKASIGSYVCADKRLDGILMGAVGAVRSVKAVEIGDGVKNAARLGSAVHDSIYVGADGNYLRKTNRAGGIEGGMTNGERIIIRAYVKPVPTLGAPLDTVDISTGKPAKAATVRSDVCVVAATGVVCEAAVALALCSAISDMLSGDTMDEVTSRYAAKRSKA